MNNLCKRQKNGEKRGGGGWEKSGRKMRRDTHVPQSHFAHFPPFFRRRETFPPSTAVGYSSTANGYPRTAVLMSTDASSFFFFCCCQGPPWLPMVGGGGSPLEGTLATVRGRCKLWVHLGYSPGDNCTLGVIGTHETIPRKTGVVLATKFF